MNLNDRHIYRSELMLWLYEQKELCCSVQPLMDVICGSTDSSYFTLLSVNCKLRGWNIIQRQWKTRGGHWFVGDPIRQAVSHPHVALYT